MPLTYPSMLISLLISGSFQRNRYSYHAGTIASQAPISAAAAGLPSGSQSQRYGSSGAHLQHSHSIQSAHYHPLLSRNDSVQSTSDGSGSHAHCLAPPRAHPPSLGGLQRSHSDAIDPHRHGSDSGGHPGPTPRSPGVLSEHHLRRIGYRSSGMQRRRPSAASSSMRMSALGKPWVMGQNMVSIGQPKLTSVGLVSRS